MEAAVRSKLVLIARDIKLSHSVFALPFALLATFLAARGFPGWVNLGLIVLCMVLARSCAMTFNRWADAPLDALNPRTAGRAIPAGRLERRFVLLAALACGAGLILAASGFLWHSGNAWPVILSPLVLAWLMGYSLTKRFTWFCHLFLGVALALSPLAAALAIEPAYLKLPGVYLLVAMVTCWAAGFDVIYALQDVEVDRAQGLYSMPARLGVEPALWVSRALHVVAVAALVTLWKLEPALGALFAVGVALTAALLLLEHVLIVRDPRRHLDVAFFTLNGLVSLLLGALGVIDVLR